MEMAPRTSGIFVQMPWFFTGGRVLVSMVPSGLRTAQQMSFGPRIMMPSISACPPTLVLKRSFWVDSLGSPIGSYFSRLFYHRIVTKSVFYALWYSGSPV